MFPARRRTSTMLFRPRHMLLCWLAVAALMAITIHAQTPAPANTEPAEAQSQTWNWHMQSTIIGQGYPSLSAKYTGVNSLPTAGQARETVSLDFFGGYRLWRGAESVEEHLTCQKVRRTRKRRRVGIERIGRIWIASHLATIVPLGRRINVQSRGRAERRAARCWASP